MKKRNFIFGSLILCGLTFSSCADSVVPTSVKLANEIDSVSYGLGMNIGTGLARDLKTVPGGKVNKDALVAGLVQALNEDTANFKLDIDNVQEMLSSYFQKASEEERMQAQLKNNEFLSENRKKEGVIVTESGLQYKIIKEGNGPIPTGDDIVKVHYTGKLLDGSIFDSSIERGTPAEFPVNGVIPGWTEALKLMPIGSKWELTIPANLAYGERGAGPIPANSILQFEVELLDIVRK